jgi:hypothetical protein
MSTTQRKTEAKFSVSVLGENLCALRGKKEKSPEQGL